MEFLVLYQLHLFVVFLDWIKDAPGLQRSRFINLLSTQLVEYIFFIQLDGEYTQRLSQNMIRYLSLCAVVGSLFAHEVQCTFILSGHLSNRLRSGNLRAIWVFSASFLPLLLRGETRLRVLDIATCIQVLTFLLQVMLFLFRLFLLFVKLASIEDVVEAHDERLDWFAMNNFWVWHDKDRMIS